MKNPPKLILAASDWTLDYYPSKAKEWSPKKKVQMVKKAGFDGFATYLTSPMIPFAQEAGLTLVGVRDISSKKQIEPDLKGFKEKGFVHINIQLLDHDTPTHKALPLAIEVINVGKRLRIKPAIEVHRDTCTETPEKAFALADAYEKKTGKKLRMNFDHSHPAIIKHLSIGTYWQRLGVRLDLLHMGELIHLRPFNGHHCQVPVTNGRGQLSPEFVWWLEYCDKLIESWIAHAKPGQEFVAVPELGPKVSGYSLSVFPDEWKDLIVLGKEIRKIWNKHIKNWKK